MLDNNLIIQLRVSQIMT